MIGGIYVNFSILNQRGTPAMFSDSLANRPTPGFVGRIFIDTDTPTTGIYRDTGTTWEFIAGGVPATPSLQAVTDVGNTTTNNVIFQSRAIVGGTATQSFHRLIVRDSGTFTTQRESLSIERTHTYDGTSAFLSGPAYGTLAGADTFNLTGSITFPNGVTSATGMFSGVTIRPAGFNITQTQGAGLRSLSGYRTQLTIEQSSLSNSTISHFAHFFATAIYKIDNSNPVTITNNYGLAISDQTEVSTGLTITNRFGIAQFGVNDRNFFLGRLTVGTSTDAGYQLDVNGTVRTGDLTVGSIGRGKISIGEINLQFNGLFTFDGSAGLQIRPFAGATSPGNIGISAQNIQLLPTNFGLSLNYSGKNTTIIKNQGGADLQCFLNITAEAPVNTFATKSGTVRIYPGANNGNAGGSDGDVILCNNGTVTIGGVIVGGTVRNTSSIFQIISTTAGFLPPVLTEAQINAIGTPAEGLMVYNSTDKTLELRDGTLWENIPNGLKGSATLDFPNTSAQNSSDLTITVTNAALNDMVMLGVPNGSVLANTCYTAFVSAANTVTVRFNNFSASAQNPASGTFRVYVIKN